LGTTALVLGIIGVCICWIPVVGWLGVVMGMGACLLGVPSVTHWFERPGYTGWGIAGISLGSVATGLGFAYQVKHADGRFDFLLYPLGVPQAYWIMGIAAALIIAGLFLARLKTKIIGAIVAGVAIAVLSICMGWSLTTADRLMTKAASSEVNLILPGK
jgi:hypothetical protein